jgi:hypothetical protein
MSEARIPVGWIQERGALTKLTLPLSTLLTNALIVGPTGFGKSAALLSLLYQLLSSTNCNVVSAEFKGELSLLLRRLAVSGARLRGLRPANILSVAPFVSRYAVPMNPLWPARDLSVAQQAAIVTDALAVLFAGFGDRMKALLLGCSRAVILAQGSFKTVLRLLTSEDYRVGIAGLIQDQDVREYLLNVLPQEPQSSKDALRARLEWLLLPDQLRGPLLAKGCITSEQLTESRMGIYDWSSPPMGYAPAARFLGSFIWTRLAGAMLARSVDASTPQLVVCLDEFAETMRMPGADIEAARILEQARWKKSCTWLVAQDISQIQGVSSGLYRSVVANTGWRLHFRATAASDVADLVPLLLSGRRVDPRRPDRILTASEERELVLSELAHLGPRQALLADRRRAEAHLIATLSVPIGEIEERAARIPAETHEAWLRGGLGQPQSELLSNPADPDIGGTVNSAARPGAPPAGPSHSGSAARTGPESKRSPAPRGGRPKLVLPK